MQAHYRFFKFHLVSLHSKARRIEEIYKWVSGYWGHYFNLLKQKLLTSAEKKMTTEKYSQLFADKSLEVKKKKC